MIRIVLKGTLDGALDACSSHSSIGVSESGNNFRKFRHDTIKKVGEGEDDPRHPNETRPQNDDASHNPLKHRKEDSEVFDSFVDTETTISASPILCESRKSD